MLKRFLLIGLFFIIITLPIHSIDGFYLGFRAGFVDKIDVGSGLVPRYDPDETDQSLSSSIPTGIGYYGATSPHHFPRIIEPMTGLYGELSVFWGYRFPRLFSLGFSFMLSNMVMPFLTFEFKFSFRQDKKIQPFTALYLHGGVLDGFPIGVAALGGIDIFVNKAFYFLIELKLGAEIFVRNYYDDGNNSNPIWHFDTTYAYGVMGLSLGFGYVFKNRWTDENGKWIGSPRKRNGE